MKRIAILLLMILAGAAAAENDAPRCEPNFVESGIEPFGRIVSYRPGQEFRLPDFQMKTIAVADGKLEFRVRGVGDAGRAYVARIGREPFEFDFDDRHYVLETAHTVLFNRALAHDELVVWARDEYHAQRAKWTARAVGHDS